MPRQFPIQIIESKLQHPHGVLLGSPTEVAELTSQIPNGEAVHCYQMDAYQGHRLAAALRTSRPASEVHVSADLWDLPIPLQTLLYPAPKGGERHLKIDMIEQAFHALEPGGVLIVFSPYGKDLFFPPALKKIFGKVHQPMMPVVRKKHQTSVFWCQKQGSRPRRRHEVTFQVQREGGSSLRFVSRPGVLSFGQFDDGARALVETMRINPGDRVLDLGCGCGTNGVIAALQSGPDGFVRFVDSNARAIALADANAALNGIGNYDAHVSFDAGALPGEQYDVILANPPYYAEHAIASQFVAAAQKLMRPDGRFYMVTKQPQHVGQMTADALGETHVVPRRGSAVLCVGTDPLTG